jgi:integrase
MGTILSFENLKQGVLNKYVSSLEHRLSPEVLKNYTICLKKLPSDLSSHSVERFFQERLKTVTGKTANNEISILKGYLKWLRLQGYTVDNAVLEMPLFRHVPTKFRRAITADEIRALRTSSRKRWPWWSFILHTGLRKSEFLALTWGDVLDDSIRVRDAKNPAKQRLVPLRRKLLPSIKGHKLSDRLFKTPKNLLRPFKNDLHRAGIPGEIDLHCLRVTFITALARAGVSPRTAQELAGHSNINTTLKIYTKVTGQDKVDAVNKLKF